MKMLISTSAILLSLSASSLAKSFSKSKDAVLLSNVRTLTLQADKPTSHRRVSAIPQLTCVGGDAKGLYNVDVMRCTNSGSEYDPEDIQWTCHAALPPEFKLGSTEVVCEGYDSPDDPYILKGSCGVEYRLILTDMGERKYAGHTFDRYTSSYSGHGASNYLNKFWSFLFWGVFLSVVGIVLYRVFFPQRRLALPDLGLGGWGGGGGGGGGGYNDDPPPPYTPRAPPRPKPETRSAPRASSSNSSRSGPGFWSGAATGAAAGYGASYLMGQRSRDRERERQSSFFGSPSASGSRGFFGGGSSGSGSSAGPGSSPAPSPSSSRYESTGFGGTRKR